MTSKTIEVLLNEIATRHEPGDRKLINQAKQVLMKQRQLSEHEAYHCLRRTAMVTRSKMVNVAREVISSAEL